MNEVNTWFDKKSKIVKIIILIIPFVNWLVELCIRWTVALKKNDSFYYGVAIIFTIFGLIFGYIDLIWIILFDHILLGK